MSIEKNTAKAWSTDTAHELARCIKKNVNDMIGSTQFAGSDWADRNSEYGLFGRDELHLGSLLGSGGFSDVYELQSLSPQKHSVSQAYSKSQEIARKYYSSQTMTKKNGQSKYAVKMLQQKLTTNIENFFLAACDLVIEAQFLVSLSHPHILKIHGWSHGGTEAFRSGNHNDFFLVLERLQGTLEGRIEDWKAEKIQSGKDDLVTLNPTLRTISALLERTTIATQVGSALNYLHSRGIVFRDLKPANIGFDEHGDVKLFDFGLAQELPDPQAPSFDKFQMSGGIGTRRYMAPECALGKRYNCRVDSYSWAIVFWEMLALEKPFDKYNYGMHQSYVCLLERRPACNPFWPQKVQYVLEDAWRHDVDLRLTMDRILSRMRNISDSLVQLQAAKIGTFTNAATLQPLSGSGKRAKRRQGFQVATPVHKMLDELDEELQRESRSKEEPSGAAAVLCLSHYESNTLASKAA